MDTSGLLVDAEIVIAPENLHAVEPLHNEPRDQFIFQTEGRKHWIIYEPKVGLPRPEQVIGKWGNEVERSDIGDVVFDGTLQEGDIIYIPRGFVYSTSSIVDPSPSVHLSIGMLMEERMFTTYDNTLICAAGLLQRQDVFEIAMRYLQKGAEWRRSLPIGFLSLRHLNLGPNSEPLDEATKVILAEMEKIPPSNFTAAIPSLQENVQREFDSLIKIIHEETGAEIPQEIATRSVSILTTLQHPRILEWEVIYSPEKYNRIAAKKRPGRTWFLTRYQTKRVLERYCNVTINDEKYLDPPETEEQKVRGRPLSMEEMFPNGETYSVIDEYDPKKEAEAHRKRQEELDNHQDEPWDDEIKSEL